MREEKWEIITSNSFNIITYKTSTIRIRGKIPFWPTRNPKLESKIIEFTHKSKFLLYIYTHFLKILDIFQLGDTHFIIAKKKEKVY